MRDRTSVPKWQIKRLIFWASELGILILGLFFSIALAAVALYFDSSENTLATAGFFCGLVATMAFLLAMRRKTRQWKIEYEAASWMLSQAEQKLHPTLARHKRTASRILLWVPSAFAAAVLFFMPVVTHVLHPSSHYLPHYRVPIPWTFSVFTSGQSTEDRYIRVIASSRGRGRFGVTPFGDSKQLSSDMVFGSIQPIDKNFDFNQNYSGMQLAGSVYELSREFRLNDVTLTCRQYRWRVPVGSFITEPFWWRIVCKTPVNVREQNLYAWFVGSEEDIPTFYKIIQGVKPVK